MDTKPLEERRRALTFAIAQLEAELAAVERDIFRLTVPMLSTPAKVPYQK